MRRWTANHNGWSVWTALAAGLAAGLGILVTSNAWVDILRFAKDDEESSHVLLVPVVFAWLIWVRRGRLKRCRPVERWPGAVMMGLGWFLWSYGYRHEIQSFWHAGAVLVPLGAAFTVLGKDVFVAFLPALGSLIFLVPVPATGRLLIAQPLQSATARVTQHVCEVLGIAVARQGNLLTINGVNVAIVEACNGMRMVFTLLLVCYTFTFVTPLRGYVRMIVLVASPLTAMVCNVIRLVPTIYIYGRASARTAEIFHDVAGWVMLIVAFILLAGIIRVLRWAMLPVAPFNLASAH